MASVLGAWKLDRSENFDDYLKELGVNAIVRLLAVKSSPVVRISMDGDVMDVTTDAGFFTKTTKILFDGKEFIDDNNGVKYKCTAVKDGDKVVVQAHPLEDKYRPQVVTREVVNQELIMTININNGELICKRIFKRLPE